MHNRTVFTLNPTSISHAYTYMDIHTHTHTHTHSTKIRKLGAIFLPRQLDQNFAENYPKPQDAGLNHIVMFIKTHRTGTFLAIQGLRHCASNARAVGSVPTGRTKIPHAIAVRPKINK